MTEYKPCPNCNEKIEQGAVLCKYCGLNVETGESYAARMERAKNYRKQTGTERKSLAFGFLILFAMVLIGGFIYQRRSTRAITETPEKYLEYVQSLEKSGWLAKEGDIESAKNELARVIEHMEEEKNRLQEEEATDGEEKHISERIVLLSNLIVKANKKLDGLRSEAKKVEAEQNK